MKLENIRYLGTHQIDPGNIPAYDQNLQSVNKTNVTHQQTYGFTNDLIVIGEPYGPHGNGFNPYIEVRDINNNFQWWFQGPTNSLFGHSIAIYGDKIVVGSPNYTAQGGNNPGAVFVFDLTGTVLGMFFNPGNVLAYNEFGQHVAANSTGFATTSLRFAFLYDWTGTQIGNRFDLVGDRLTETAYETGLASNNNWGVSDSRRCNVRMNDTVLVVTYQYPYQYPLNAYDYSGVNYNIYGDTGQQKTVQSRLYILDMDANLVQDCTIPNNISIGGKYLGLGLAITDDRIYATSKAKMDLHMQIIVFDLAGTRLDRFKLIDESYHSVQPTLSVNGKYICVGNTAGRPNNDLNPNLGPNFFQFQDKAELNLGQVDIYDTTGLYLGSFRDTYDFYNPTPTPQLGWVTQINDNNQLLIDGMISNPVLLDIIEEAVDTPKDVSLTATLDNNFYKLRDITGQKGTQGVLFEGSTGGLTGCTTYNVNIATLTSSVSTSSVQSCRASSVMADGARIFNLGGEQQFSSVYSSGVRVFSPIFDVSAVSPYTYAGTRRAKSASADDGKYAIHVAGDTDGVFPWGGGNDELIYNMYTFSNSARASTGIVGTYLYTGYSSSNSMTTDGSRLYIQDAGITTLKLRHILHTYTTTLTSTNSQLSGDRSRCGSTCDGSTLMFAGGGAGTSNTNTIDYFSITLASNSTTIGNLTSYNPLGDNQDCTIITDMSRAVGYYNNAYYSGEAVNPQNAYLEYTNISSKANSLSFGNSFGTTRRMQGSSIL